MSERRCPVARRWYRFFLAALAAVLVGLLGAGTASAATLPGLETRVGAITPAAVNIVGPHECITAGQRWGHAPPGAETVVGSCVAAKGSVRFGQFAADDLRAAAQLPDRNGLTQVGRGLQIRSTQDVMEASSTGSRAVPRRHGTSRTSRVMDDILNDSGGRTEALDRVTNIFDSSGRGVRFGNDGSFMGFLEPRG